jgi:transposase
MLSATAPVTVSSGRTDRHRLSRLGDQQHNRALRTMAISRMHSHPPTLAYVQRRRAEGKTDREIRRCIKRYLARHLYCTLSRNPGPDPNIGASDRTVISGKSRSLTGTPRLG